MAAVKAVGAQGAVRGPGTWERVVVVAKGQGRMERAAAAARVAEATGVARAAVVRVAVRVEAVRVAGETVLIFARNVIRTVLTRFCTS